MCQWKLVHPPGVLVGATRSRARSGGSRLSVGCVNGNMFIPLESWLERLGPGLGVGAVDLVWDVSMETCSSPWSPGWSD